MVETRVKICGITTPEDAAACYDLGADYLGVIFAPSQRRINCQLAAAIREWVPRARLVGVFADAAIEDVVASARAAHLDLVQLHGRETSAYCRNLRVAGAPSLVKVFHAAALPSPRDLAAYKAVSYVMFDLSKDQESSNGTREELWRMAASARRAGRRVFLAGGLSPSNVRAAVREAVPFCVDVCSGVEREPGRKDVAVVKSFIAEVRHSSAEVAGGRD